jgi:hypothetical protein
MFGEIETWYGLSWIPKGSIHILLADQVTGKVPVFSTEKIATTP